MFKLPSKAVSQPAPAAARAPTGVPPMAPMKQGPAAPLKDGPVVPMKQGPVAAMPVAATKDGPAPMKDGPTVPMKQGPVTPSGEHGAKPPTGALQQALGHYAETGIAGRPSALPMGKTAPAAPAAAMLGAAAKNVALGTEKPGKPAGPQKPGDGDPSCQGPPELGTLSARYESNGDPGTVSTGYGDMGGVSYGSYQMSTASGSAGQFVSGSPYASEFAGLQPGTPAFSDRWREIAARDPAGFQAAQHEYIKENYYDVASGRLQQGIGLDPNTHSNALQQVIWSTSVQHGAYSSIVEDALAGRDVGAMSDTDLINAIYAERGRTDENGALVHFGGSSWDVQQGVANRFRSENTDALNMLLAEQGCSPRP